MKVSTMVDTFANWVGFGDSYVTLDAYGIYLNDARLKRDKMSLPGRIR
jgi:hypothetical protein